MNGRVLATIRRRIQDGGFERGRQDRSARQPASQGRRLRSDPEAAGRGIEEGSGS